MHWRRACHKAGKGLLALTQATATVLDVGAVTARTPPSPGMVSDWASRAVRLSEGLWLTFAEKYINKLADGAYPVCARCYVFFIA